jgi:UPF0755 protein
LLAWLVGTVLLVELLILFPQQPGSGRNREVPIWVEAGSGLEDVARLLVEHGALAEPQKWLVYMRLLGAERDLYVDNWIVSNASFSAAELMPRLASGRGITHITVTVPEGFTRFDVAKRFERHRITKQPAFLHVTQNARALEQLGIAAKTAEGYLFPATYTLRQDSSAFDVVGRMVRAFRDNAAPLLKKLADKRGAGAHDLSDHEALTLASIVEREARVADERPIIAGVFLNRLRDPTFTPHRLQADPTVAYGCLEAPSAAATCADFDGRRITPVMVRDPDNPYNTYRIEGLPPGPISNPGLSALSAVIDPADHDFFYFVTKGGGRHAFSHSLDEHNQNIHGPR